MLQNAGKDIHDRKKFPGLAAKISALGKMNLIPADLAQRLEITTSRNKILHGKYEPVDQEYTYSLCVAAIVYLKRTLKAF